MSRSSSRFDRLVSRRSRRRNSSYSSGAAGGLYFCHSFSCRQRSYWHPSPKKTGSPLYGGPYIGLLNLRSTPWRYRRNLCGTRRRRKNSESTTHHPYCVWRLTANPGKGRQFSYWSQNSCARPRWSSRRRRTSGFTRNGRSFHMCTTRCGRRRY